MKPTNPHHGGGHADDHNDDVAHEHSDINVRAVVMSAVVVTVVCVVTAGLMYGLFWFFEDQALARDPKLSPLAMPATNMPSTTLTSPEFGSTPGPRLLTNEPANLEAINRQMTELMGSTGWVDQAAGVARIPIDHAKSLLVNRGLPVRPDPVTDALLGTRVPAHGESSSGRVITSPLTVDPTPAAPAAAAAPAHKDH
jgi:hypothetical protein